MLWAIKITSINNYRQWNRSQHELKPGALLINVQTNKASSEADSCSGIKTIHNLVWNPKAKYCDTRPAQTSPHCFCNNHTSASSTLSSSKWFISSLHIFVIPYF